MSAAAEATVRLSLIDRITAPIRRISARIAALGKGLGVDRLGSSFGNLGKKLGALGGALGQTSARLAGFLGLVGVGGAGAVTAMAGLVGSVADLGAELTESSFKLGVGVEALQELRYAAMMNGVEQDTLGKAIEKVGINASAAAHGNKAMAANFKALGVAVKDAEGNMRPVESVLNDTLAALAGIEDPMRRNELAFKLFGKSGVEMTKMLGDGAQGLADMRTEARATGHVISEAAAAMGDEYGDNVDRLTTRLTGLRNLMGVSLLPVLNSLVQRVTEWYDANQGLIRSTITEWAAKFAGVVTDLLDPTSGLRQNIDGLVTGFGDFLGAIQPAIDFVGGPGNAVLLALGAYIGGPLIAAFASLGAAVVTFGATLLATPLGWIIAGIAAVAAGVYLLIENWDAVVAAWNAGWDYISGIFSTFAADVVTWFTVDLGNIASAMIDGYLGATQRNWAAVVSWGSSLAAMVAGWFNIDLYAVGEAIVQTLLAGLQAAWAGVTKWLDDSIAGITNVMPDWVKQGLGIPVVAKVLTEDEMASKAREAGQRASDAAAPMDMVWDSDEEKKRRAGLRGDAFASAEAAELARLRAENEKLKGPDLSAPSAIPAPVETPAVEATTVNAAALNVPEPIIANQPQNVDASMSVTMTVNVASGDSGEVRAAVKAALAEHAASQRSNITSALND